MKIDLDRAQLGLVATTLLEKLVDDGDFDYTIIATDEKASLSGCVKAFCDEIVNPKVPAKKKKKGGAA